MKLSLLNLVPVREGQDYATTMQSMVTLAQHAEKIGMERLWNCRFTAKTAPSWKA